MWEEKLDVYDKLVALSSKFERKGKTVPYTSANGYMFSLLNKEGELGIRLAKESQTRFNDDHNSTIFMSHGAVMRDYVLVPESLLENLELLANYLDESFEYVMTLEPK